MFLQLHIATRGFAMTLGGIDYTTASHTLCLVGQPEKPHESRECRDGEHAIEVSEHGCRCPGQAMPLAGGVVAASRKRSG